MWTIRRWAPEMPEAVVAVAIRQLTRTQRVLAGGTGTPPNATAAQVDPSVAAPRWVTGADGYELASALESVAGDSRAVPHER